MYACATAEVTLVAYLSFHLFHLFHLAFSHRHPTSLEIRIDNSTSLSTPLTLTTIFFSKFHTFSRDFFHRCFSMVGLPSCHLDFSGEELDLGIRSLFFDEDFRQLDSFYSSTRGHSTNSSTSGLSRILWTYS